MEASARRRAVIAAFVVSALAGVVGLWLVARAPGVPEPTPSAFAPAAAPAGPEPATIPARHGTPPDVASDGIPIMPHEPTEADSQQPMHPHAHTPKHDRIYRENNLVGQLSGAMDVKDTNGMRRLLERYRHEYPEDPNSLQQGYEIILDCLERPSEETRASGERYWRERKSSILRRYVRRHCLETSL